MLTRGNSDAMALDRHQQRAPPALVVDAQVDRIGHALGGADMEIEEALASAIRAELRGRDSLGPDSSRDPELEPQPGRLGLAGLREPGREWRRLARHQPGPERLEQLLVARDRAASRPARLGRPQAQVLTAKIGVDRVAATGQLEQGERLAASDPLAGAEQAGERAQALDRQLDEGLALARADQAQRQRAVVVQRGDLEPLRA